MPKAEKRWEHKISLIFNGQQITRLTITDHYQQKHSTITNELILSLVKNLDKVRLDETDYPGHRKVFKWAVRYQEKNYRLIFWHEKNNPNHLWIRNCFRID